MKTRATSVRLLVSNFPACFRFYERVMGFTPLRGHPDDVCAEFDTGSGRLCLLPRAFMAVAVGDAELPEHAEGQDRMAVAFTVDNVDEACRQLEARGATLVSYPQDRPEWGVRTAHLRDPDNNLIEISSPLS
ncbi:MAG: VOC family protein [Chloroherpetonaceae bacterium]|nr:VOC family protein [Chthonomonadaceae bacterium]MDW8207982.1 VOC family protein [Chloroherpetonaceae bacterium]